MAEGTITVESHSELTFTSGLRAAAAGLPFLPTRGAMGSDIATDLDLATVDDPYGSGPLHAVQATELDVAVIHAERVDRRGSVAMPSVHSFLWDADALVARAAQRVYVTTEKIVERVDGPALLTGFEVHGVVEVPDGAAPGALPGAYPADDVWLSAYADSADPRAHLAHRFEVGGVR